MTYAMVDAPTVFDLDGSGRPILVDHLDRMRSLPDDVINKAELIAAAEARLATYDDPEAVLAQSGVGRPAPKRARPALKSFPGE